MNEELKQDSKGIVASREAQARKGMYLEDNREKNPIQRAVNNTGLPDNLKSGVEQLSGQSLDDVKVHYNSAKPAQLNAHAYAQGSSIHLASGQENHLPHEAWHVAQQKQGRVQATTEVNGAKVNDNVGLEREADVMGAKAVQMKVDEGRTGLAAKEKSDGTVQRVAKVDVTANEWRILNSNGFHAFAIARLYAPPKKTAYASWLKKQRTTIVRKYIERYQAVAQVQARVPRPAEHVEPVPQTGQEREVVEEPSSPVSLRIPARREVHVEQEDQPLPLASMPEPRREVTTESERLDLDDPVHEEPASFEDYLGARNITRSEELYKLRKSNISANRALEVLRHLGGELREGFVLAGSYAAFLQGNGKIPNDIDIDVHNQDDLLIAKNALVAAGFKVRPSMGGDKVVKLIMEIPAGLLDPSTKRPERLVKTVVEIADISALNVNSKTKPESVLGEGSALHPGVPMPSAVNMILNWLQRIHEDKEKARTKKDYSSIRRVARSKGITEDDLREAHQGSGLEVDLALFRRIVER